MEIIKPFYTASFLRHTAQKTVSTVFRAYVSQNTESTVLTEKVQGTHIHRKSPIFQFSYPLWDILSRGTGARRHWDTRIITDWDSSQKSNSYALGQ